MYNFSLGRTSSMYLIWLSACRKCLTFRSLLHMLTAVIFYTI